MGRAEYTGTMATRRLLPLLCTLFGLLCLPAAAVAQAPGIAVESDPASALPERLITQPVAQEELAGLTVELERSGGLPDTWCGAARTDDDTLNEVAPAAGPNVKLVYAYAAGKANRFDDLDDKLQASVSLLSRYLAGQAGGAKTVRFDRGTNCGPQYADIQTVALPNPLAYYVDDGAPQFAALAADVRAAIDLTGSQRNLLVYADGMRGTDGVAGAAERHNTPGSDVAGAANPHNDGGLVSAVFGPAALPSGTYAEPATMMHELAHNLGAVQASAPHVTDPVAGGHCTDEHDLMCYADGGPNNTLTYPCATRDGQTIDSTFDCGRDDYFDPAPEAGSYLATSWNLFDSAHLSGCADPESGDACGVADTTAPLNTTPLPPAGWRQDDYEVVLSATDTETGVAGMEWRVDGGSAQQAALGATVTVSGDGAHVLYTRAIDEAGNASVWREDDVLIDGSNPVDTTDPGPTTWRSAPTTVTITGADAGSGFDHMEWRLDAGATQTAANGYLVPIAGDGEHTLFTRAVDVAGNASLWRTHTIRIDTVLPVDETATHAGWRTAPAAVVVAGSDAHSGIDQVRWRVDAGATTTVASGTTVTVSAEGEHTLYTQVFDRVGHTTGWKAHPIKIDTTAPDNLTATANEAWQTADYAVLVQGADGGSQLSHVEWRRNGGAVSQGPSGTQASVTGTGDHTLETRAVDVAGNASGWRLEHIRIDRVDPTNTTAAVPATPVGDPYLLAVTGTDAHAGVARVEWRVDGGPVQAGASGAQATVSGHGSHTLETRVVDGAGNDTAWRLDEIEIDTGIDTTPPTDTTTTAPSGWRTGPVDITVAATDAGHGVKNVQWRIDGEPLETHPGASRLLTFATEGVHLLETRAEDNNGNLSAWRAQTIRIDLTVPTDTTAIGSGWQPEPSFTLSATDAHSGVDEIQYRVDGGPDLTAPSGTEVAVPGDGVYTIEHRVIDGASHASQWKTSTLQVDSVAPVNASAVAGSAWRATALELPLSGTDDRSGLDTMQWRLNGGAVRDGGPAKVGADGVHQLATRALDAAGNASAWRTDTVRVDVTAPRNDTPAAPAGWRADAYSVTVKGSDGSGSGVAKVQRTLDGGPVSEAAAVAVAGDGVHTLRTRIVDKVGHASPWRSELIHIDSQAPQVALACSPAGWSAQPVSCAVPADGGPSGLASLTVGGGGVAPGGTVVVEADGIHVLDARAVDGAGNQAGAQAQVMVDRSAPQVELACDAADGGYACRVQASDAVSGVASVAYSVDGGEWAAAEGVFTVASGSVRARAVDAAGNHAESDALELAGRAEPRRRGARTASLPVYLRGRRSSSGMIGALRATRTESGAIAVDLRPLAVGRGRYRVVLKLKAGSRDRKVRRTRKVGKDGALPRIKAKLPKARGRATVSLTIRKRRGGGWRRHAGARLVIPR